MWVVLGLVWVLMGMGQCPGSVRGESHVSLREPHWGREQIGVQGKGRERNQHRRTFDGVVFYMGVCWDGAHGKRHYPVYRRNPCPGGSLAIVRAWYGHWKRGELETYKGTGGPGAAS
jgi:hypothetical protein